MNEALLIATIEELQAEIRELKKSKTNDDYIARLEIAKSDDDIIDVHKKYDLDLFWEYMETAREKYVSLPLDIDEEEKHEKYWVEYLPESWMFSMIYFMTLEIFNGDFRMMEEAMLSHLEYIQELEEERNDEVLFDA